MRLVYAGSLIEGGRTSGERWIDGEREPIQGLGRRTGRRSLVIVARRRLARMVSAAFIMGIIIEDRATATAAA
eukprot:1750965-Pyramimonas_sp.AAC.1